MCHSYHIDKWHQQLQLLLQHHIDTLSALSLLWTSCSCFQWLFVERVSKMIQLYSDLNDNVFIYNLDIYRCFCVHESAFASQYKKKFTVSRILDFHLYYCSYLIVCMCLHTLLASAMVVVDASRGGHNGGAGGAQATPGILIFQKQVTPCHQIRWHTWAWVKTHSLKSE